MSTPEMRALAFPTDELPPGLDALMVGLPPAAELTPDERQALHALFQAYEAAGGRADLLAPDAYFNGARAADFRRAYKHTRRRGRLRQVRTVLTNLVGNRCPSCAGGRPADLDHHAPQSEFAEYALCLKNLVCTCRGCNGAKLAHVPATDEDAFIHPYFDAVPDVPYIAVTVVVGPRAVTARLAFDDAAPIADPVLKARMKHQFDRVDVNYQVRDEVSEVIREFADNIEDDYPEASPAAVSTYLEEQGRRFAERHWQGFWKAALLRALAADAAFCGGGYRLMLRRQRAT